MTHPGFRYILIGHSCATDDTLPDDVAGRFDVENGYPIQVLGFHTEKEAKEYEYEDYWLPDGVVFEVAAPE